MSSKNSNQLNIPEARDAMDQFKMESARDQGVFPPLKLVSITTRLPVL